MLGGVRLTKLTDEEAVAALAYMLDVATRQCAWVEAGLAELSAGHLPTRTRKHPASQVIFAGDRDHLR